MNLSPFIPRSGSPTDESRPKTDDVIILHALHQIKTVAFDLSGSFFYLKRHEFEIIDNIES